jgi:hypothetical protein
METVKLDPAFRPKVAYKVTSLQDPGVEFEYESFSDMWAAFMDTVIGHELIEQYSDNKIGRWDEDDCNLFSKDHLIQKMKDNDFEVTVHIRSMK